MRPVVLGGWVGLLALVGACTHLHSVASAPDGGVYLLANKSFFGMFQTNFLVHCDAKGRCQRVAHGKEFGQREGPFVSVGLAQHGLRERRPPPEPTPPSPSVDAAPSSAPTVLSEVVVVGISTAQPAVVRRLREVVRGRLDRLRSCVSQERSSGEVRKPLRVQLKVTTAGRVIETQVDQPSGHASLDGCLVAVLEEVMLEPPPNFNDWYLVKFLWD